ncbi:MAG: tRNA (adenosine(37)-N6)-dimethylallyltransferase MiaA [Pseudohongiellaceae bacterium]
MGATATGKTALAVDLVQRFPFDIISVDSAQIYRGMDIGTGKPDADTLRIAPHRLIDIRDPAQAYSASEFREDAVREIDKVRESGRVPLLVGGTMLYFKLLRDGLASMPAADAAVRSKIEAVADADGWHKVHEQLARVDPVSAARIHPNDPQRLQRALEVFLVSGRPLSSFHQQPVHQTDSGKSSLIFHFFALQAPSREVLHHRIADRFRQMLADGLVEEVDTLYRRGDLSLSLPSMRSVGYRQVWRYLSGEMRYDAMVERGIIATRQLAKRQLTWLRSWDSVQDLYGTLPQTSDEVLNFMRSISI